MKKIIYCLSLLLSAMSVTSCSDFFDPDTDDELNGEEYIGSDTEMYTGFLGIMTKLQAIGDKEILLTDTRADLIEVTEQSTPDLIAIYNYDNDLTGNPYANPEGYYEVIIACNDYLTKMKEYRREPGVDPDIAADLMSSAIRIKAWTYKTLAEIYGEAVWFDDPVTKVTDLTVANGFRRLALPELIDECIALMDNGYDGVDTQHNINWVEWLDPEMVTKIADSNYRKWNYMVPPYAGIYAELYLWKAAVIESQNPDAPTANPDAQPYYQKVADLMLSSLSEYIDNSGTSGGSPYWMPSSWSAGKYKNFWDEKGKSAPLPQETVSALIYDYSNNQTNALLKHFSNEYPNEYLLRPNEKGKENYLANTTESDQRYKATFGRSSGVDYIAKFRSVGSTARPNPYEDDVQIYLYRSTQYHMMLAEALNHLKRFYAMDMVFNSGTNLYKDDIAKGGAEWEGISINWTASAEWGTRKYYAEGIRACHGVPSRDVVKELDGTITEHDAIMFNDMAILDETMIEFHVEGKVYPMMNRMALRYGDLDIIADRVAPKYESAGKDGEIRGKILAGGNWVKYDLMLPAE